MIFRKNLCACGWLALAVCTLVLSGCGSNKFPTGTVEGKVFLGDAPYTGPMVVFLSPKTGHGSTADIQPDGSFRIKEPLRVGNYTVFLTPKPVPEKDGMPMPVTMDRSVPDKYWNEGSDISVEIKEGKNDIQVKLVK